MIPAESWPKEAARGAARNGPTVARRLHGHPQSRNEDTRMHQREAATAAQQPGAATAHLTIAEAREALQQADRNTPIMVGMTWTDDWTIVDDREEELRLRDSRHNG